ncbi:MAG: methyltransferase domain-containing protein [Rhodocyclaceae bacterium]
MPPDPQSQEGQPNPMRPLRAQSPDCELDRAAIRKGFARAAGSYDLAPVLQREVARRMARRLDCVRRTPSRILDLGCGTGADLTALSGRYPRCAVIGCDLSLPMLRVCGRRRSWVGRMLAAARPLVCADALRLPFGAQRFDLVWSNLALQWTQDLAASFAEALRVLDVGGLLMFSMPGPDTLSEVREAFAAADASPHVHRFPDMHDVGDLLVSSGFADPVMEMERITLTYADARQLFLELRQAGAANCSANRRRGLTGRAGWQRMLERYEGARSAGRLPAGFEILYGHAWKPQPRATDDGRAIVRFAARAGAR